MPYDLPKTVRRTQAEKELDRLVERSRRLGADLSLVHTDGSNTSAKITLPDPLTGRKVDVLWVKGTGVDLKTIDRAGFASVYLDGVLGLEARWKKGVKEDDIMPLFERLTFDANRVTPSLDTATHAVIPARHVDHTHPSGVLAIGVCVKGSAVTKRLFGGEVLWIPWRRSGFEQAMQVKAALEKNPDAKGIILGHNGLLTWGETSEECYQRTREIASKAEEYVLSAVKRRGKRLFGGARYRALPTDTREALLAAFLPILRGRLCRECDQISHVCDSPSMLAFVNSADAPMAGEVGAGSPDHLLRTRYKPMLVDWNPNTGDLAGLVAELDSALNAYRRAYLDYYERNRRPDSPPLRGADPTVVAVPGLGVITFGADKREARITGEFCERSISAIRGAAAMGGYKPLSEKEAFGVEYWALEEAKRRRQPPPILLSGRVALITGGAGGIGSAVAHTLAEWGAHIAVLDIAADRASEVADDIEERYGEERAVGVFADVTDEESVARAFRDTVLTYGGVDIVINNAGISTSHPVDETSAVEWDRMFEVLSRGYFLVAREAFRVMKAQGLGGSIVFVGSKSGLAPSRNSCAYSSAKASIMHLARCLAEEGGPLGIRVNTVNPGPVAQGGEGRSSEWRAQRAQAHGVAPEDLDEYYRKRTTLGADVEPYDVAAAITWFASNLSCKTTGNVINVDGGVPGAYPR